MFNSCAQFLRPIPRAHADGLRLVRTARAAPAVPGLSTKHTAH